MLITPVAYAPSVIELYKRIARRDDYAKGEPYEKLLSLQNRFARLRHFWGLFLVAVGVAVALSAVFLLGSTSILDLSPQSTAGSKLWASVATAVGTAIGLGRYVYGLVEKRLGEMDLVAGEIVGIGRVYAAGNIVGAFVQQYLTIVKGEKAACQGFADSARQENYNTIYERTTDGLGSLSPALFEHIALFYTFFKGARDATGALKLWGSDTYPDDQRKADIVNIVYLCFLQILNGRLALKNLIDDRARLDRATNIFIGVELQCFSFLLLSIEQSDYRYPSLKVRLNNIEYNQRERAFPFFAATIEYIKSLQTASMTQSCAPGNDGC